VKVILATLLSLALAAGLGFATPLQPAVKTSAGCCKKAAEDPCASHSPKAVDCAMCCQGCCAALLPATSVSVAIPAPIDFLPILQMKGHVRNDPPLLTPPRLAQ
jgi:hypothetical protein